MSGLNQSETGPTDEEVAQDLHLPLNVVQECREIFNLIDLDGGGSLDAEEMMKLMDLLGMMALESEVKQLIENIDTTGEGEVFFPDFVKSIAKTVETEYSSSSVIRAFDFFSQGKGRKHGQLRNEDLLDILTHYGEDTFSNDEALKLISSIPGLAVDKPRSTFGYAGYVESTMF